MILLLQLVLLVLQQWIWTGNSWIWTGNSWIWTGNSWISTRNSYIWTRNSCFTFPLMDSLSVFDQWRKRFRKIQNKVTTNTSNSFWKESHYYFTISQAENNFCDINISHQYIEMYCSSIWTTLFLLFLFVFTFVCLFCFFVQDS